MKEFLLLLLHLLTAVVRVLGRDGAKTLVAENLLIEQLLLILTRCRQRAPNVLTRTWSAEYSPNTIERNLEPEGRHG